MGCARLVYGLQGLSLNVFGLQYSNFRVERRAGKRSTVIAVGGWWSVVVRCVVGLCDSANG